MSANARGPSDGPARARLMGLRTLLGDRPEGFFVPYRYADTVPHVRPPYAPVERLFASAAAQFEAVLARLEAYAPDLEAIGADAEPPQPRWHQSWFPRLDAAVAYVTVRDARPARIVEVGSGHSTRFLMRALADGKGADGGIGAQIGARIDAIDPAPRADLSALEGERLRLHRTTLQAADPGIFAGLAPGDVVSVDSSHILMPGTDVDWFLGRILPALPAGVLLHVHDMLLPDDYPEDWAWRGYNEQAPWVPLLAAGAVRPLWSSHWATTRLADRVAAGVAARLPLANGARETSLWMEKVAPAV